VPGVVDELLGEVEVVDDMLPVVLTDGSHGIVLPGIVLGVAVWGVGEPSAPVELRSAASEKLLTPAELPSAALEKLLTRRSCRLRRWRSCLALRSSSRLRSYSSEGDSEYDRAKQYNCFRVHSSLLKTLTPTLVSSVIGPVAIPGRRRSLLRMGREVRRKISGLRR